MDIKQVIVVRRDLNMRKGKMCAQVAHAAMKFIVDNNESDRPDQLVVNFSKEEAMWLFDGPFTKIVLACDSEDELKNLILKAMMHDVAAYSIVDSGKTEFHGVPTLTCVAFGPDNAELIDKITGHLKPL